MMRALVACGWFGIQTWIGGGAAILLAVAAAFLIRPWSIQALHPKMFGITGPQFVCVYGVLGN